MFSLTSFRFICTKLYIMFSHYLFWNLYCNCSFKHIWDTLNKRCSFASNFVKVDLFMCRKSQGIFYSFFCLSRYFWQTIHLPSPSLNCLAVGWGGCVFVCLIASRSSLQAVPVQGSWVSVVSAIRTPTYSWLKPKALFIIVSHMQSECHLKSLFTLLDSCFQAISRPRGFPYFPTN